MTAPTLEGIARRVAYSFSLMLWVPFGLAIFFCFVIAWPWWVVTGTNIMKQREAPFRWLRWLDDNLP